MQYKITHVTTYAYREPVPVCHNEVHLTPRDSPNQRCGYHRLLIKPHPASIGRRFDFFGNPVGYFSIHQGHERLRLKSISRVTVAPRPSIDASRTTPWEMVRDSLRVPEESQAFAAMPFRFGADAEDGLGANEAILAYTSHSFRPGRPIMEGLLDLTARIHADFVYDSRATQVTTGVEEAFRLRRGVCQDFAHVGIACLRSIGLAARYVSGYLRTVPPPGQPRLVGADASHAWLSLYCGDAGWVDVDPTNNSIPSEDHVTLAWGRGYSDVCPIKGIFLGGGQHQMTVSVDVDPQENVTLEEPEQHEAL